MKQFESKLKDFIQNNHLKATHLVFEDSCHTVEEAALAANTSPDDIVKNICMIDDEHDKLIVAIVKGKDKVSFSKIGKALNIKRPRIATPEEILNKSGFPVGGVPSFGYEANFLVDKDVMELNDVYTGGGSPNSLVKISTNDLQKTNNGIVVKIKK